MAVKGAVTNALDKGGPETTSLTMLIKQSAKELGQALPSHLNPERLVRIALTAVRINPELAKCTPESFLGSLFVLAQIGLEPIAGRAYLLPFKNKKKINGQWVTVPEVQALIGYKGLIDLFYRNEAALSIEMHTVNKNDSFDYEYGNNGYIKHKPALGEKGEVVGYYAIAKMKEGGCIWHFMSKEECMAHGRKHSKTWITQEWKNGALTKCDPHFADSSPWNKDPDSMCMKTVLIQLAKVMPLSVELQKAISVDETSREYRKGIDSALDLPDTTNWEEQPVETTAEPVKEADAAPVTTSKLPKNILDGVESIRKKLNNEEKFKSILGSFGCTKVEEIPDVKTANEVIREASKQHAEAQG